MMPSHPKVTEEIRAAYRSDGVVKIPGAVSGEWLSEIAVMAVSYTHLTLPTKA